MKEYFEIIRAALAESRKKGNVYYEAHHIIPKSFGKKSSTVLLTPEEHYRVHKILAQYWKEHRVYSQKMLWAFHRLAYDGKRRLTAEEYGEARKILQLLWSRAKTDSHKANISKARQGKKTVVHPDTNEIKYIPVKELQDWIKRGWKNTNYTKGTTFTVEHRSKIGENTKERLVGRKGSEAQAAKGPYTVLYETGEKITAGSYPELSKATGIPVSTLQNRLKKSYGIYKKNFTVLKGE